MQKTGVFSPEVAEVIKEQLFQCYESRTDRDASLNNGNDNISVPNDGSKVDDADQVSSTFVSGVRFSRRLAGKRREQGAHTSLFKKSRKGRKTKYNILGSTSGDEEDLSPEEVNSDVARTSVDAFLGERGKQHLVDIVQEYFYGDEQERLRGSLRDLDQEGDIDCYVVPHLDLSVGHEAGESDVSFTSALSRNVSFQIEEDQDEVIDPAYDSDDTKDSIDEQASSVLLQAHDPDQTIVLGSKYLDSMASATKGGDDMGVSSSGDVSAKSTSPIDTTATGGTPDTGAPGIDLTNLTIGGSTGTTTTPTSSSAPLMSTGLGTGAISKSTTVSTPSLTDPKFLFKGYVPIKEPNLSLPKPMKSPVKPNDSMSGEQLFSYLDKSMAHQDRVIESLSATVANNFSQQSKKDAEKMDLQKVNEVAKTISRCDGYLKGELDNLLDEVDMAIREWKPNERDRIAKLLMLKVSVGPLKSEVILSSEKHNANCTWEKIKEDVYNQFISKNRFEFNQKKLQELIRSSTESIPAFTRRFRRQVTKTYGDKPIPRELDRFLLQLYVKGLNDQGLANRLFQGLDGGPATMAEAIEKIDVLQTNRERAMAFGIGLQEPSELAEINLNEINEFKNQQQFVTDTIRKQIDNTSTKIAKLDDHIRREVFALKNTGVNNINPPEFCEITTETNAQEGGTVPPRGRGTGRRSRFRYRNFGERNYNQQQGPGNMGARGRGNYRGFVGRMPRGPIRCYTCGELNHMARNCLAQGVGPTGPREQENRNEPPLNQQQNVANNNDTVQGTPHGN